MIVNFTQHEATQDQINDGVVEPIPEHKELICKLLTFDERPEQEEVENRAVALLDLMSMYDSTSTGVQFMVGGAPYLMCELALAANKYSNFELLFAFSKRESVEQHMPDGSVQKKNVFKHDGFVKV